MNLKLEPLLSTELMKITPEKEAYFYLYDKGFTENEINYIKKCNEKEGITFCVKTISFYVFLFLRLRFDYIPRNTFY